MRSKTISSERADVTRVFLDANVLAKPVTRTILIVGGPESGFRTMWSRAAELEAARHLRARALPLDTLRHRLGIELSPSSFAAHRFETTSTTDQQILADACATKAHFLITEDVDDFGQSDLVSVGISAVNPDLFLAARLTRGAYRSVIDLFVGRQTSPPTTAAAFHGALARQHPRLFSAHADVYDAEPVARHQAAPAVLFRGDRCLRCTHRGVKFTLSALGHCETCRA